MSLPSSLERCVGLANQLCASKVLQVIRHLEVRGPETPAGVDPRAKGVFEAVQSFALELGLLKAGSLRPTAKLLSAAPYGELLLTNLDVIALDPIAFRWLSRALDGLESVLRGQVLGEEVLFPNGDFSLARNLYAESPLFSWYSTQASGQLGHAPRVLELGAGTGATHVLRNKSVKHYLFTDLSPALLQDRTVDVRQEVQKLDIDQAWDLGTFDLILAVNTLHLSMDVPAVLERVFRHLQPGGRLVLGEVSPPATGSFPLMELTFGLLPSFWRSCGDRGPLFLPSSWTKMLQVTGFSSVVFHPLVFESSNLGGVYVAHRSCT